MLHDLAPKSDHLSSRSMDPIANIAARAHTQPPSVTLPPTRATELPGTHMASRDASKCAPRQLLLASRPFAAHRRGQQPLPCSRRIVLVLELSVPSLPQKHQLRYQHVCLVVEVSALKALAWRHTRVRHALLRWRYYARRASPSFSR